MAGKKSTYSALVSQIEQLKAEAEEVRRQEALEVIARIREAIGVYELTPQDLFGKAPNGKKKPVAKPKAKPKKKLRARFKYSDGDGNTWGGMGPRPAWLRQALADGKQLEEFRVASLK